MNLRVIQDDDCHPTDFQGEPLEEINDEACVDVSAAGLEDQLAASGNHAEAVDLLSAHGRYAQLLVLELPGVGHVAHLVDPCFVTVKQVYASLTALLFQQTQLFFFDRQQFSIGAILNPAPQPFVSAAERRPGNAFKKLCSVLMWNSLPSSFSRIALALASF